MAKGRKMKPGKRKPCGRLVQARFVEPNDEVLRLRQQFPRAPHEQLFDAIGKAWASGLLDSASDPAALRDIGRSYAELYWHIYASLDARAANYGGRTPKSPHDDSPDRKELRFRALDAMPTRTQRRAIQQLCVDGWWFQESPAWLLRLMQGDGNALDQLTLKLAIDGLSAMVYGTKPMLARCA
jgi:hypothetical protein